MQETVIRLGGRPRNFLEWHPTHLEGELREDNIIEAYLLAKVRARRHTVQTGGLPRREVQAKWREMERGTLIWEGDQVCGDDGVWRDMPPAPFARDIAALGVAFW